LRDGRGLFVTIAEVNGAAATTNRLGRWRVEDLSIVAVDGRGFVEYSFTTAAPDLFRLEVEGRDSSGVQPSDPLELWLSVDGESLERVLLSPTRGGSSLAHALTPWLLPGSHTVRVFWDNARRGRALRIAAVRLQALAGPDTDGDGIKDWVQARLRAQNSLDAPTHEISSLTSPAFLEGGARFPGLARLTRGQAQALAPDAAALTDQGDEIRPGAGARWYADVPLAPGESTMVEVAFEHGAMKERRTLVWTPLNLLTADALTIRRGDALWLVARADAGSGTPAEEEAGLAVQIAGVTNYFGTAAEGVVHRFTEAGVYEVTGGYLPAAGDAVIRSVTVTVVGGTLAGPLPALAGQPQAWDCPDLPANAVVEADPRLTLEPIGARPGGGRRWRVTADAPEPRGVVARIMPGGPIFASTVVQGFRLFQNAETYVQEVEVYPDGSQIVETGLVLSPVLPGVTVRLDVLAGGVIFDDGTLVRVLAAPDFDALGQTLVRFSRPSSSQTSVCHSTTVSTYPSSPPGSSSAQ
jgi:hypothetical protein